MGKQEYPSNALTANRLMTDFIPATDETKQRSGARETTDVAFVETKDGGG